MVKFILRLLKNVGLLVFILWPLELLGILILLPIIALNQRQLSSKGSIKLPVCFRWFDNADIYEEFNRNSVTYLSKVVPEGVLYRYYWLAIRNPLNYFGYKVLGYKATRAIAGSPIGDDNGKTPGYVVYDVDNVYEYYYIKKWSATKCLRFRLGWKLQNTKAGEWAQWVLVLQPYKDYWGK